MLGVRPLGERPRVLERAVHDAHRPDPALAQMLHGEGGHRARSDDHHLAPSQPAHRVLGEVGAERHERVGSRAERRLLPHPASGARRRVEEPGQRRAGGALGLGAPQRLAHLGVDLRLAEDHRVEPARDGEQVIGRVALPVGVHRVGEFVGGDPPRLDEQALQRHEPGVVARDLAVDLDPVAGRQDHGAVDAVQVGGHAVRLGEVVVGEREPLQQLDRRATEGDPEGEDGHGR